VKNQLQTFLTANDEDTFSQRLRDLSPTVAFVDYDQASLAEPTTCTSLLQCPSGLAWIWASGTESADDRTELWITGVASKSIGPLVQFQRSRLETETLVDGSAANLLLSGRVAIAPRNDAETQHKKHVYEALNRLATSSVYPVSPTTRERIGEKCPGFRVGRDAEAWSAVESHLLRHAATKTLYCLPQSAISENV
jgi:hypothetical protein